MKKLIAVLMLTGVLSCRAQVYSPDADAQAYCASCRIYNPAAIDDIELFVQGLKQMNLWDSAAWIADGKESHNLPAANNAVMPIKGASPGIPHGSARVGQNGLVFTGNSGDYVEFNNPMNASIDSYTLFVAFSGTPRLNSTLIGSYDNAPNKGIFLGVGSPVQGGVSSEIYHDFSSDGTASETVGAGNQTAKTGNPGGNSTVFASYSKTLGTTIQTEFDVTRSDTANSFSVYNGAAKWRIGSLMSGSWPWNGTIACVAIFNRQLSDYEITNFRRLYTTTIGKDFIPKVNIIFEGDSLTTATESYVGFPELLLRSGKWAGRFNKRDISHSGDQTSQMVTDLDTQVKPYWNETRYIGQSIYVLLGGANDVNSISSGTTFANLQQCWATARSCGYKVMALTVWPSGGHTSTGAANRNALNQAIKTAAGLWDYMVDTASIPELQDPTNLTYFDDDTIHLTNAGYQKVADAITAKYPNF